MTTRQVFRIHVQGGDEMAKRISRAIKRSGYGYELASPLSVITMVETETVDGTRLKAAGKDQRGTAYVRFMVPPLFASQTTEEVAADMAEIIQPGDSRMLVALFASQGKTPDGRGVTPWRHRAVVPR